MLYLHDLRFLLLDSKYYEGQWRLKEHIDRNGNFYTTHTAWTTVFYLNIGRGDNFSHLISMSESRELNLVLNIKKNESCCYILQCSDMNNTLIKTYNGKQFTI